MIQFSRDYDGILRRYSINHDEVDYELYQLEHPDEFPPLNFEMAKSAEKNVKSSDRTLDKIIFLLMVTPAVLALGATLASDQFAVWFYEWINHLFGVAATQPAETGGL